MILINQLINQLTFFVIVHGTTKFCLVGVCYKLNNKQQLQQK